MQISKKTKPAAETPVISEKVSELETQNKTLAAQVVALSNRNDFVEECIAEMATKVYTQ